MSAAQILAKPLCALAFCWRLERRDGVAIGLTSHDRPLIVDGFRFTATPGVVPSAIRHTGDMDSMVMDVESALSVAALSEDDLAAGRWDGAAVSLHLTEWTEPGVLWFELASGTLGLVRQSDGAFSAALENSKTVFRRSVVPLTSPGCRATLGDADCRVALARRRERVAVDSVAGDRVTIAGVDGDAYAFGRLRWLGGPRCGLFEAVLAGSAGELLLAEAVDVAIPPGTPAVIEEGCDKTLATCAGRFANAANFRGEPFLPGNDLLTRYPGA